MKLVSIPTNLPPQSALFSDLLEGKAPDGEAQKWVRFSLGWEDTTHWYLVLFRNLYVERVSENALVGLLAHHIPQGFCFSWKGHLLMLVGCQDWDRVAGDLSKVLEDAGFRCGVSMPFSNWEELPVSFRQAEVALDYAGEQEIVSMCEGHAWNYLVNEVARRLRDERMLHPAIERLEEYDRRNGGSDLARTLYEYLRNERSLTRTARALFLHRNSLRYRLLRIGEIISADLDNPDTRMHLMLSYEIKSKKKNDKI
jgi:hypothetical protein